MIKNYRQDGEAAQSVEGRNKIGQPGRTLTGSQRRNRSYGLVLSDFDDSRGHYREIPSKGELAEA